MKIIQSFWTRNCGNLQQLQGKWLQPKFLLMSWALSAHRLSQFYEVELFTDSYGQELLIEELGLPYAKVHLVFDHYDYPFDTSLWCYNKLYSYSLQKEPFIHVDGDVFIWSPFSDMLCKADLVAQNLEADLPSYRKCLAQLKIHFSYWPSWMQQGSATKPLSASNAGIMGGHQVGFFKQLRSEAFEWLDRNRKHFSKVDIGPLNIMVEQYLFWLLGEQKEYGIEYWTDAVAKYPEFLNLQRFHSVPWEQNYIHIMGGKNNAVICEQMANRLLIEEGSLWQKCQDMVQKKTTGIPGAKKLCYQAPVVTTKHILLNWTEVVQDPQKVFYRTILVLDYFEMGAELKTIPSIIDFLVAMKALIGQNKKRIAVLRDVFDFEYAKYNYLEGCSNIRATVPNKAAYTTINRLFSLSREEFCQLTLRLIQPERLIASTWCWTEINAFYKPSQKKKGPFLTALHYYLHSNILLEQCFDPLSKLLIEILSDKAVTVRELVEQINRGLRPFPTSRVAISLEEIKIRLSDLAYHGIIELQL